MKTKTISLTLAALAALPGLAFAQNTFPADGNVGIGTAIPSEKLDILNGNLVLGGANLGGNNYGSLKFRIAGGGDFISLRSATGGAFGSSGKRDALALDLPFDETSTFEVVRNLVGPVFAVRATGQTFIGGNLGIGTALPVSKVHVNGDIRSSVSGDIGGEIILSNPSKAGSAARDWRLFNMTGSYGDSFQIRSYSDQEAGPRRFVMKDDGTTLLAPSGGNVGIGTDSPESKLDVNGKINCTVLELTSDRNQKQDFAAVDVRRVLDRLVGLPIMTWAYTNDAKVRHLGPMAQDWKAAYPELGSDDKHIGAGDLGGIAIAALQGLNAKVTESLNAKDAEIAALKDQLLAVKADQANIAARFEKLEKVMAQAVPPSQPAASSTLTADAR